MCPTTFLFRAGRLKADIRISKAYRMASVLTASRPVHPEQPGLGGLGCLQAAMGVLGD